MILENFPKFTEWFLPGMGLFLGIIFVAILLGLFFGYVVASFRHGPFEAFYVVAQVVAEAVPDFLQTSPRRIYAIARLAAKEALRRKVIVVAFLIFVLLLLFGQWFMNGNTDKPEERFISTVMFGTQLLTLLTMMLVSAFSLPEDIRFKTIYTVVTKPVRATEVILGRIIGFGFLGTVLLSLMALISFFFVSRNLKHTHRIVGDSQTIASLTAVDPNEKISAITGKRLSENAVMEGQTEIISGHSHQLEVLERVAEGPDDPVLQGKDIVKVEQRGGQTFYQQLICNAFGGHSHEVTVTGTGPDAKITLGPAVGYFRARVPIYANNLTFLDRDGKRTNKGISVGKESSYRGFIDGGNPSKGASLARAIFEYHDIRESRFGNPDKVPLELQLGVFRTYKANIERQVTAGLQFESVPDNENENRFVSNMKSFETQEYQIQVRPVNRKVIGRILAPDGSLVEEGEYDLYNDFAANGKLRIKLACLDRNQYLGCARADIYFRASDEIYTWNFVKGYIGIWCQMMIIIAMSVAFSTFLSSPIVMLGVIMMMVVGFYTPFIRALKTEAWDAGGPIESFYRLVTQSNMRTELERGWVRTLIEAIDNFMNQRLSDLTYLAPNFSNLDFSKFLTHGYAIDTQRMIVAVAITLAFCIGLTLLGYFSLKTREIAK